MDSTSITLEDFTNLPEGMRHESGARVRRCPRCGRNGLRVRAGSENSFLHVQTSRIFGDGILTEPQDRCSQIEN